MPVLTQFPGAGCIVEFLQGNEVQIAWVMEEQKGKLRLFLPNRRETTLAAARVLPWAGPVYAAGQSKDVMVEHLARHLERREKLSAEVKPVELWEMAQGEVASASALWLAELAYTEPDADRVAACGRVLLRCKTHFHFQPPEFEIYNAATVEAKMQAEEAARQREAMVSGGAEWFRELWEAHLAKKSVSDPNAAPEEPVRSRLVRMLRSRIKDPESTEDEALWKQVTRGLPDDPFLPLLLAHAWGLVPEHYNFWLDRADYAPGTAWEEAFGEETAALALAVADASRLPPLCGERFISIDSETTRDIDDAFAITAAPDGGWDVQVALACPAWFWDFDSPLGRAVAYRATSLYLPEGNYHMMPEALSEGAFSLFAGKRRPAFLVSVHIVPDGSLGVPDFRVVSLSLASNLHYQDCDAVLDTGADNAALPFSRELLLAWEMGKRRLEYRIFQGAVIIERPELDIILEGDGADVTVRISEHKAARKSQLLVAELMILANAALAAWAVERGVPLLFRTQDVTVPKEYAGVWRSAPDIARVARSLVPASLDVHPRPHTGMGLAAYSSVTSPLRRFTDLVNEAQVLSVLTNGKPRWDEAQLSELLLTLDMRLEPVGQVQKNRMRYWKYVYLQQQTKIHGEECRWEAEVLEENDMWVNISLPEVQIGFRGKRSLFGEKLFPGQKLRVRLGKINPLRAEASILAVCEN